MHQPGYKPGPHRIATCIPANRVKSVSDDWRTIDDPIGQYSHDRDRHLGERKDRISQVTAHRQCRFAYL
ncbi:hypothetical protein PUN4_650024 [Paraburkholderia unamae]|nr:hypothetical protein PUN4_650024 [Paraburkholderia unamae]